MAVKINTPAPVPKGDPNERRNLEHGYCPAWAKAPVRDKLWETFNGSNGLYTEDGTVQFGTRPFTLLMDVEFTAAGTTQTIFNKFNSAANKRTITLRHLAPNHLQMLYSTNGIASDSLSFGAGAVGNERMYIELSRAGNTFTLIKNGGTLDTDVAAIDLHENDSPMRLGAGLIGTIYSASLVFND